MNNSYSAENGKKDAPTTWWKRRSKMEKALTIFSAVALLLIVILLILIIIYFTRGPTTCLTATCVCATHKLLEHMDTQVDPCADFYQFACGSFIENTQLEDYGSKSVTSLLYEDIQDHIQGIVEEPEGIDDPRSLILAKKLYAVCVNDSAVDERGLKLIKDSLRQIGGWPAVKGSSWKEKDYDWKSATYKLREMGYGFEFFIDFQITADPVDPSTQIIKLNKPYNRLIPTNGEEDALFQDLLVNISVVFGANESYARYELVQVADFMRDLFKAQGDDEVANSDKYDPWTISELQYKFSDIEWLEYINRLQFPAPNISYDQIVSVSNTPYYLRLLRVLRRTSNKVIANFIAWWTVMEQGIYLTTDVTDLIWKYLKMTNKLKAVPPRTKFCLEPVSRLFYLPLQAAYIQRYFSSEAKNHVVEILQNIKNEFREVITDLEWMDEETRTKALERLSSSTNYVAFPNDLLNRDKIEERYTGQQVEQDVFLASLLNANYYSTNFRFRQLHEPPFKDKEFITGYVTYPWSYYWAKDNTITVPAGFLRGIIYDDGRPQYMNYGALGSTLGRHVFHTVFEEKGCKEDSKYYDWLSTHTLLTFNDKLSCVATHYGKYAVPEIGEYLNSSNTKYEDIADIAGAKLAYSAYNKWLRHNGPERKLPGLDYTPKQLFWTSLAMRFCEKSSPGALENTVGYSYKSPSKFRVLGSLRNSEDFSKDFYCSADSYMNDDEKCEIW